MKSYAVVLYHPTQQNVLQINAKWRQLSIRKDLGDIVAYYMDSQIDAILYYLYVTYLNNKYIRSIPLGTI